MSDEFYEQLDKNFKIFTPMVMVLIVPYFCKDFLNSTEKKLRTHEQIIIFRKSATKYYNWMTYPPSVPVGAAGEKILTTIKALFEDVYFYEFSDEGFRDVLPPPYQGKGSQGEGYI